MSEATQTYLPFGSGSEETDNGFYSTLDYIRENANTQYGKGRLFERLIRTYLLEDPFYQKRFSEVYLWSEWAELRPEFDGVDIGIDLVAEERDGGYCAIQCKCYAETHGFQRAIWIRSSPLRHVNPLPPECSWIPAAIGVPTSTERSTDCNHHANGLARRTSQADRLTGPISAVKPPNNSTINKIRSA